MSTFTNPSVKSFQNQCKILKKIRSNLSELEENKLLKLSSLENKKATEKILIEYKPLISYLAFSFSKSFFGKHASSTKEELVQEGGIGLLAAIKNYDSEKGPFFYYARSIITGYIKKSYIKETIYKTKNFIGKSDDCTLEKVFFNNCKFSDITSSIDLKHMLNEKELKYIEIKYNFN